MYHVYPLNDEKEHELEGTGCWCEPRIDWEYSQVIHNAADCRGLVEQAEAIMQNLTINEAVLLANLNQQPKPPPGHLF